MAKGWSQQYLGELTAYSTAYVSHVETGKRIPSLKFAKKCDELFGTDHLVRLWELISKESYPTWFRPWLELEHEAHTLRSFQPVAVPGLLQTPDYARAMLVWAGDHWNGEKVEELVRQRISRQELLQRDDPPRFLVVLDELALLRPIGGAEVMRGQLEHLVTMAENHPRVSIQVIPLETGAHPGLEGPMVVGSFRHSPDIVYLESSMRGEIITDADEVLALTGRFDAIRLLALPQAASLERIRKAMDRWT